MAGHREKDGRRWALGSAVDVDWITSATSIGLTVTAAIPPIFDAYVTIVVPDRDDGRAEHVAVLLDLLDGLGVRQPWWLGYLDTGADELVFPDAPMVTLYSGWRYVLVEAGREQAASWRSDESWRGTMPDLVFPADRSWLLSTMWDDDWRCLGGSMELIRRVLAEPHLEARPVRVDEPATPPGHIAR